MVIFGKDALQRVIAEYVDHYHQERNHQGKENVLLFPTQNQTDSAVGDRSEADDTIECRERLVGLLKYYYKNAA